LSWCGWSREQRVEEAAVFGIAERDLDSVIAWADRSFDTAFGAWNVFFTVEDARAARRSLLALATDVELWGVGLHRDLRLAYCEASKPSPAKPGFAPVGASGVHIASCVRPAPLASGGTILGHELLVEELGGCWNSPESRHLDEAAILRAAGVVPNDAGLIDSFDEALACAKHFDSFGQPPITGWLPWLLVRYPRRRRRRAGGYNFPDTGGYPAPLCSGQWRPRT
jgi:hypothetical protein